MSVSLPDDDVKYLDHLAAQDGYSSRSAVVAAAISRMRELELTESYAEAFDEWASGGEAELWDSALSDGLPAIPPDNGAVA